MQQLEDAYKNNQKDLMKEYAYMNNPYKIGDIIEDHSSILKIETIRWRPSSIGEKFPSCVYYGIQLTKKLEPSKRQDSTVMHQVNVERKLN
jgi:hypothetical protein